MSKCGKSRKNCHRRQSGCGPIKRVIRALAQRFGISRGMVITGFVLGFVFMPLLTLFFFLGAWLWVDSPQRVERGLARINASLIAAFAAARKKFSESGEPVARRGGEERSEKRASGSEIAEPLDFPELRRAFDDLERRTAGMEAFVTSNEYQLRREFKQLNDSGT